MNEIKTIQLAIRELRQDMKTRGIKRTSCFNGGLDRETYLANTKFFALETKLIDAKKRANA
jgi:hypothetical protein